eukprot:220029-Chlamydomonas_euryale.AAC.2
MGRREGGKSNGGKGCGKGKGNEGLALEVNVVERRDVQCGNAKERWGAGTWARKRAQLLTLLLLLLWSKKMAYARLVPAAAAAAALAVPPLLRLLHVLKQCSTS